MLVAVAAFLVYRQWRRAPAAGDRSRRDGSAAGPAGLSGPELARQANALLIATDERIRDARQEVDFAEAQYGAEEVTQLRAAVASAQDDLREAFTVRQRLDDDVPEDEATRDAMLREIVERTTRAQATLDHETDRIRQLRDLERDAPNTLVRAPGPDRGGRGSAAGGAHARSLVCSATPRRPGSPSHGHLEEAEKGLAGARNAVIVASGAMSRDDRSEVARRDARGARGPDRRRRSAGRHRRLAAEIAEAERRIPGELDEAERDLAETRSALAAQDASDPAVASKARAAELALEAARRAAAAVPPDPTEALRLATEAHRLADEPSSRRRRRRRPCAPRDGGRVLDPDGAVQRSIAPQRSSLRAVVASATRPGPVSPRRAGSSRRRPRLPQRTLRGARDRAARPGPRPGGVPPRPGRFR